MQKMILESVATFLNVSNHSTFSCCVSGTLVMVRQKRRSKKRESVFKSFQNFERLKNLASSQKSFS